MVIIDELDRMTEQNLVLKNLMIYRRVLQLFDSKNLYSNYYDYNKNIVNLFYEKFFKIFRQS